MKGKVFVTEIIQLCCSRSVSNGIVAVDFGNFLNNSINESSDSRSVYLIFLAELKIIFPRSFLSLLTHLGE